MVNITSKQLDKGVNEDLSSAKVLISDKISSMERDQLEKYLRILTGLFFDEIEELTTDEQVFIDQLQNAQELHMAQFVLDKELEE